MQSIWQIINQMHDLYCNSAEDNPNEWSIWRESTDEQITPWFDLGAEGGIVLLEQLEGGAILFKLLAKTSKDSDELEGLYRWPEGMETGQIFRDVGEFDADGLIRVQDTAVRAEHGRNTWLGGYGLLNEYLEQVLPCSLPGYWGARPKAIGAQLLLLADCLDPNSEEKLEWRYGLYSRLQQMQLTPCQYIAIYEVGERLFALLEAPNKQTVTDVFDLNGAQLTRFDYQLLPYSSEQMYVEQGGLWGQADISGEITRAPFAKKQGLMDAEPSEPADMSHLALARGCVSSAILDEKDVSYFLSQLDEGSFCVKYEPVEGYLDGDGYCDVELASLAKSGQAFWIEDRYASERFHLLVLTAPWRKLPRGTLLRIESNKRLIAVAEDGHEINYIQGILAQTMDFGFGE